MSVRHATLGDVSAIYRLIAYYAQQGVLLRRDKEEIRGNIGNFLVHSDGHRLVGCISLEGYGTELGEIRSIAVAPEIRGRGVGSGLIESALAEARRREIVRVFAVTHLPQLFVRSGFTAVSRQLLTEKIDRDCQKCSQRSSCTLTAVIATVHPGRLALPVIAGSSIPVSVI